MNNIRVAVLDVAGATGSSSISRVMEIMGGCGMPVEKIIPEDVREGKLDEFQVLVVPGGVSAAQARALKKEGCVAIEKFIGAGGGYIGICAGAYLASAGYNENTSNIELVNAEILDFEHCYRGVADAWISITDLSHPVVQGFQKKIKVHYENGPVLGAGSNHHLPAYHELAEYLSDIRQEKGPAGIMPGSSALTVSDFGKGRCVLYSFHPELTTGLERMLVQGVQWVANAALNAEYEMQPVAAGPGGYRRKQSGCRRGNPGKGADAPVPFQWQSCYRKKRSRMFSLVGRMKTKLR